MWGFPARPVPEYPAYSSIGEQSGEASGNRYGSQAVREEHSRAAIAALAQHISALPEGGQNSTPVPPGQTETAQNTSTGPDAA